MPATKFFSRWRTCCGWMEKEIGLETGLEMGRRTGSQSSWFTLTMETGMEKFLPIDGVIVSAIESCTDAGGMALAVAVSAKADPRRGTEAKGAVVKPWVVFVPSYVYETSK